MAIYHYLMNKKGGNMFPYGSSPRQQSHVALPATTTSSTGWSNSTLSWTGANFAGTLFHPSSQMPYQTKMFPNLHHMNRPAVACMDKLNMMVPGSSNLGEYHLLSGEKCDPNTNFLYQHSNQFCDKAFQAWDAHSQVCPMNSVSTLTSGDVKTRTTMNPFKYKWMRSLYYASAACAKGNVKNKKILKKNRKITRNNPPLRIEETIRSEPGLPVGNSQKLHHGATQPSLQFLSIANKPPVIARLLGNPVHNESGTFGNLDPIGGSSVQVLEEEMSKYLPMHEDNRSAWDNFQFRPSGVPTVRFPCPKAVRFGFLQQKYISKSSSCGSSSYTHNKSTAQKAKKNSSGTNKRGNEPQLLLSSSQKSVSFCKPSSLEFPYTSYFRTVSTEEKHPYPTDSKSAYGCSVVNRGRANNISIENCYAGVARPFPLHPQVYGK